MSFLQFRTYRLNTAICDGAPKLSSLGPSGLISTPVTVIGSHALRPVGEFGARPLETVIAVAHFASGQSVPVRVIFAVGRGQNHGLRARPFPNRALERGQTRRIQMLDDFDQSRRIEIFQTVVAVSQSAVQKRQALAFERRHAFQMQLIRRHIERAMAGIDADNFFKLPLIQEGAQQSAFAATQI